VDLGQLENLTARSRCDPNIDAGCESLGDWPHWGDGYSQEEARMTEGRREGREAVVVCLPERHHVGELPANVEVVLLPRQQGPLPDLRRVELLVPADWARQRVLAEFGAMARLRVVQTLSAGVDWLRGRVPAGVVVCNARGAYDEPMAEWVVGAILAMQRGLITARDAQMTADWRPFHPDELAGLRAIIVGFGSIGSAVAVRLRPFGVDVVGVARTRREGVLGLDDFDEVLPSADILIDLLPLTAETVGLLDARRLGQLQPGALLVNAGRGATVDTPALVDALRTGRLRAALDVTDPEPLPPDHPLWRLPGVLISPHVAGNSRQSLARAYALVSDQIRRFAAGERLENEVPPHLLM
jgi:phosphoglycerate dehydrogenase-like enzyme